LLRSRGRTRRDCGGEQYQKNGTEISDCTQRCTSIDWSRGRSPMVCVLGEIHFVTKLDVGPIGHGIVSL
jgi:hypothetical protein